LSVIRRSKQFIKSRTFTCCIWKESSLTRPSRGTICLLRRAVIMKLFLLKQSDNFEAVWVARKISRRFKTNEKIHLRKSCVFHTVFESLNPTTNGRFSTTRRIAGFFFNIFSSRKKHVIGMGSWNRLFCRIDRFHYH
jgi:hypothetical protein